MKRKQALAELIAKVDAGEVVKSDLDAFIPVFGLTTDGNNALDAYRGSLDSAKALRMSILPGPVPEKIHSDAREELLSILRELIDLERA